MPCFSPALCPMMAERRGYTSGRWALTTNGLSRTLAVPGVPKNHFEKRRMMFSKKKKPPSRDFSRSAFVWAMNDTRRSGRRQASFGGRFIDMADGKESQTDLGWAIGLI